MKYRKILVVFLVFMTLLGSIGSVGAYMRKQTAVVSNVLVPAEVSCEVVETFSDNTKTEIFIKNTGDIEAYLRLHVVTYWVDANGDILFKEPKSLNINYNDNYWLKSESGDTYYYMFPVQPGDTKNITNNLLASSITLITDADGNKQVVEVFAEAIQSEPTKAVTSAWNVTLDGDNIKSVN